MRPASFVLKASIKALPGKGTWVTFRTFATQPRIRSSTGTVRRIGQNFETASTGLELKRFFAARNPLGDDVQKENGSKIGTKDDGSAKDQQWPQEREQLIEARLRASRLEPIAQAAAFDKLPDTTLSEAISKSDSGANLPPQPEGTPAFLSPQNTPAPPSYTPASPFASSTASSLPLKPTVAASSSSASVNGDLDHTTLPSHTAGNRSKIVARFHVTMERILEKATVASQRVNSYTGTDYSGIEALRTRIKSLEGLVKVKLDSVTAAKEQQSIAMAAQSASQKEVVQLLERKHSWLAADLERYMTIVRSEHVNEQAVQAAKDGVAEAEREVEEVRARLEKYERKQYHEEQIWSDTIRRNSTWVTFGLMGFNILLLLFSLVAIEPWRRKRLVMEIELALDEKTISEAATKTAPVTVTQGRSTSLNAVQPDLAAESSAPNSTPINLETASGTMTRTIPLPPLPGPQWPGSVPNESLLPPHSISTPALPLWGDTWVSTLEGWRAHWADLFSERSMAVRRVDLTAAALEGAAAGAACMGLLFVLLRPR